MQIPMEGKRRFNHLQLAHEFWKKWVQEDSWAIDATCGNGHDTLILSKICRGVIALDVQEKALENTRALVGDLSHVHFFLQNHETFPKLAYANPISLIVYNLGYLPGGNKTLTTLTQTTLKSLQLAMEILLPRGLISLTCYPGHPEGAIEKEALLEFVGGLNPKIWNVCHHQNKSQNQAPSLLLLQKIK